MKVFVTGASGFIGSHLVDALLSADHEVTALVRKTSSLRWLENKAVRLVTGDVRNQDSLAGAVKDQQVIFHVAGRVIARSYGDFQQTNHLGTENVMEAILKHNPNVHKVIYVSSLAVGGPTTPDHPLTEEDPSHPISAYGKSKYDGERVVFSYRDRINVLSIRPPVVYGPRDRGLLNFCRIVANHLRVNLGLTDRYTTVIHVADLVDAMLLAGTKETESGTLYYVDDGQPVRSWFELEDVVAGVLDTWTIKLRVPLTPVFLAAAALHAVQRISGKRFWLNLTKYRELAQQAWLCDGGKIRSQLGYAPKITLVEGMRETVTWYRKMGWIK